LTTDHTNVLEGRRIVAIASFDSFVKTAQIVLDTCSEAGARTELLIAEVKGRSLSDDQMRRAGASTHALRAPLAELLASNHFLDADAAILLCDGKRVKEAILRLSADNRWCAGRPKLVAAYPGILYRLQVSGFMDRAPVDLLCLNSEADLTLYRAACIGQHADYSNAVVTGLPLLWDIERLRIRSKGHIVFFEQPSVPPHSLQREYVVHALCSLARHFPDRKVLLKTRTKTDEATFHRTLFHLEDLLRELPRRPGNLVVTHEPVSELLPHCSLALTFSSTAALESLASGIPTRILTDFGVNETIGNSFFAESDMLASFDQISGDENVSKVSERWLATVAFPEAGKAHFVQALSATINEPLNPRPIAPFAGSAEWSRFAKERAGFAGVASGRHPKTTRRNVYRFLRYLMRSVKRHVIGA
jgi:hypothetical protein